MHQKERNSNSSALYFVIYESKNVRKLEVVDLKIYLIPLLKFAMSFLLMHAMYIMILLLKTDIMIKTRTKKGKLNENNFDSPACRY